MNLCIYFLTLQDNGGARSQKRTANAVKRNKKKLKALNVKIAAAKIKLKGNKSEQEEEEPANDNAGNAFGGKKSKKKD